MDQRLIICFIAVSLLCCAGVVNAGKDGRLKIVTHPTDIDTGTIQSIVEFRAITYSSGGCLVVVSDGFETLDILAPYHQWSGWKTLNTIQGQAKIFWEMYCDYATVEAGYFTVN